MAIYYADKLDDLPNEGNLLLIANAAEELRRLHKSNRDLLEFHKKHMELMMEIAQELKNPRMPINQTVEASIRMLALAAKESLDAIAKATGANK